VGTLANSQQQQQQQQPGTASGRAMGNVPATAQTPTHRGTCSAAAESSSLVVLLGRTQRSNRSTQ